MELIEGKALSSLLNNEFPKDLEDSARDSHVVASYGA